MRHIITSLSLAFALFCAACSHQAPSAKASFTQHHSDGRVKPSVHVMPVRDLSGASMPWSLAEEFDSSISASLLYDGSLYVMPRTATERSMENLATPRLDSQLNDLVSIFSPSEFLVELELVRHTEGPCSDQTKLPVHMQGEAVKVISVDMRVRLFDLRLKKPKLLLQEIVAVEHFVDQNKTAMGYQTGSVTAKGYSKTPIGQAHAKLANDVAERIEHYVAIAKSRPNAE